MNLSKESFGMTDDDEVDNQSAMKTDSQWQLRTSSRTPSEESNDSNKYYQSSDGYELQILQKKDTTSSRPVIPATRLEKLAFVRSYVASSCKTEFTFTEQYSFSIFLWNYIYNIFGKSLPSSYLYIFLGSYAPDHHLFVSKMVPLCHGLNFFWILVGLLQLISFSTFNVIFLDYAVCGILYDNPWNWCGRQFMYINNKNANILCYDLDEFIENSRNKTLISDAWAHEDSNHTLFHLSQFIYYLQRRRDLNEPRYFMITYMNLYIFIYFVLSSLACNQIFKRSIWKIHAALHYALTTIYAITLLHLYCFALNEDREMMHAESINNYMQADLDLIAESMTSPPILHILTSRSNQEVKVGTDTALFVTSNAFYYIFRGLVEYKLRKHCSYLTNARQHFFHGPAMIFFWPLYLSSVYMGGLYTIVFLSLLFLVEFCSFIITHQCLVEVFVCEWRFLKRRTAVIIILVVANILQSPLLGTEWVSNKLIAEICGTNIIMSIEITIICLIYPLGRLIEDIRFHYGMAPTLFAVFLLQTMIVHYLYKTNRILKHLVSVSEQIEANLKFMMLVLVISLIIGLILKLYQIVYKNKKDWKLIWCPDKYWGSSDLSSRLLRKKFSSDRYIASQAPRDLSRNLFRKAEFKVYRLGLRYIYYDTRRRSTQPNVSYHIKNEIL